MTIKKISSIKILANELGVDRRTLKKMIVPVLKNLGERYSPKCITPAQEKIIRKFLDMD